MTTIVVENEIHLPVNNVLIWIMIQVAVPLTRFVLFPLLKRLAESIQDMEYQTKRKIRYNLITGLIITGVVVSIFWIYSAIFK